MRNLKLSAIKPGMAILFLILTVAGCKKPTPFFDQINTGSGDANRKAVVKIIGAENDINVYALDVVPTLEDFVLIQVGRDPNTSTDLNQSLTVKLVKNSALITAYNTANTTTFIELPLAAYTLANDISTLTFAPGEVLKAVIVHLKKDQMDLSKQYALGFTLTEVGAGAAISATKNNVLYSIGLKNKYDGRYRLDGAFYHPVQSPAYAPFTVAVEMHTTGASTVKLFVPDFGGYYSPGLFAGTLNAFGAQEPAFTVNPATNAVTVQNAYSGAVTFYTMAPGYNSRYDPATKTIYAKWGYNYDPGPVFNPANNREWTDVFTYLGPR